MNSSLSLLAVVLLLPFAARSQHEADNWYFGDSAALSFAGGGMDLHGDQSACQAALAAPFPDHPGQYFLFTVGGTGNANGLQFSIIDMSLDGGLGDINTSPVVSNVGGVGTTGGQLKISPNGRKMAVGNPFQPNSTVLFDFDNQSGVVSNPVTLLQRSCSTGGHLHLGNTL